jgi:hypothetical protein
MRQAALQIAENSQYDLKDLEQMSLEFCLRQDVMFTGGYPEQLSNEGLLAAASQIRSLVKAHNRDFQDHSMRAKLEVDRELTRQIQTLLPMDRLQASEKGVWSALSTRAVPDLAQWRYPNDSNQQLFERYVGHERNILQRLWWRSELLGPELACQLQEDDLIQMFERPTIGTNPVILKAIAGKALEYKSELARMGGKSSAFVSEVAKAALRVFVVVSPSAMADSELHDFVEDLCVRQIAILGETRSKR